MADTADTSCNTVDSGVFLMSTEADLLADFILCTSSWETVWNSKTYFSESFSLLTDWVAELAEIIAE